MSIHAKFKFKFVLRWFKDAVDANIAEEPNQMAVASADSQGRPSLRFVLLKGYDERGFVFFTNYGSRKGQQLQENESAALCMYWEPLQRQVSPAQLQYASFAMLASMPSIRFCVSRACTFRFAC